jgi:PKD repeat protein
MRSTLFAIAALSFVSRTEAQVITAPWTESFSTVVLGTPNFNAGSTIPAGWSRTPVTSGTNPFNASYAWGGAVGATHTRAAGGATGPQFDHTTGSGGYVYVESSGGAGNSVANLVTPPISIVGLTAPELVFFRHQYGTTLGNFQVLIRPYTTAGTGTWTPIFTGGNVNVGDFWNRVSVLIPVIYQSDTVELNFRITKPAGGGGPGGNNQFGDLAIDDISVAELNTCPDPESLVATRLSATQVALAWTTGGATSWRVEYGAPGFAAGSGTKISATTNPFTVGGLTPATNYEFRVKDSCSATDVSNWSSGAQAMTDCGPLSSPWFENFDGANWTVPAAHWAYGGIDTCWSRPANANYWWRPNSGPTPTGLTAIGTGPSADHTTGSGTYMHGEAQNGTGIAILRSPSVMLAGLLNPELRFYYHQFGPQIDSLVVKVFRNGTESRVWGNSQQTSAATAPWTEAVVSLSSFLPDTVQIRWYAYRSASNQNRVDVAIDDVSIDNPPVCPKPTNLTVTTTSQTAGTMTWNPSGPGTYEVIYGTLGQVPYVGTIVTATSSPFSLTGLSAGTTYAVAVRKVCSPTLKSAWSTIDTLTTLCGVVVAPYFENFEVGFNQGPAAGQFWNQNSTVGPCWVRTPLSSPTPVKFHWGGGQGATSTPNTGPDNDHTTGLGKYVYTEASFTTGSRVANLQTPQILLSGLTTPELRFWYHMDGQAIGSLRVEVQTGSVTSPYVVLDSIVGQQGNSWNERVVSLSAYANQTVRIRFRARALPGNQGQFADIAIDDMSVQNAPPCPAPTAATATALTSTSVSVQTTQLSSGTTIIEYGPVGFTLGAGTQVTTTSNPYTVTGLTAGQAYDFYVFDSCSGGFTSAAFGPVSATTFNCPNGCNYILKLQDSFGDGWSSGGGTAVHILEVIVNGVATPYTLAGANDTAATFMIPVCDNDALQLRFVNNGVWSDECGWQLRDASGTLLHSEATGGPNLTTGVKFSTTTNCSTPCPTPTAAFTWAPNGLSFSFNAASSFGAIATYAWDFGDGTTGSGVNPVHAYATFGSYTVQLIATDNCAQSDTLVQQINACTGTVGTLNFSANGYDVTFTGPSDPAQFTSISWNFGDGATGTGANPTHSYGGGGTYTVILTATDLCGSTFTQSLTVTVCAKPTADFTFRVLVSNGSGMTVEFDASASLDAVSYQWTWGDGNSGTGGPVRNYTYGVAQLGYSVRLIVNSACGTSDTIVRSLRELGESEWEHGGIWVPNPARAGAQLQWIGLPLTETSVRWFGSDGRLVAQCSVLDAHIEVPQLPEGMYWMEWSGSGVLQRVPIVIHR